MGSWKYHDRLIKPWILCATLKLYKIMVSQSGTVWFVISWVFWESLAFVPTTLNAILYILLLDNHLHSFMTFCHPHRNGVFQQDGCSYHKFWLETVLLDKHSSDMSVLNWPPRNPGFYPIEKSMKTHFTAPVSVSELWTALAVFCQAITVEKFRKLFVSMSCRASVIFKAKDAQLVTNCLSVISWHFSVEIHYKT